LGYASVQQCSIESACAEREAAPSANRLREVLHAALPERAVLQRDLNTALRQQLPRPFRRFKRSFSLAVDLTLIPYYGDRELGRAELLKAQAKAGPHYFHGYATVSIVHHWRRYVLAVRFVSPGESMVKIVRDLLDRVRQLGVPVRRVYLDKEFYAYEVFRLLDRRGLAYVIPVPARAAVRRWFHGRSRFEPYTLQSGEQGDYRLQLAVVHRRRTHRSHKPVGRWFAYACAGLPPGTRAWDVFERYRQRFGIETSYRQMNQLRARTSSRRVSLRLLLVGLALLVLNLYVALRRGHTWRRRQWLTLLRLMKALARAVEAQFGIKSLLQPAHLPIS
jgi:putative transposase